MSAGVRSKAAGLEDLPKPLENPRMGQVLRFALVAPARAITSRSRVAAAAIGAAAMLGDNSGTSFRLGA